MENKVSECSEILHTSYRPTWRSSLKVIYKTFHVKKKPQWSPFKLSNDTNT
jgi:hypothetical protein